MLLKKICITAQEGTLIREVTFKDSLNIILGKEESTGSTNSIGKTTLLRCIDFCLDGKPSQFYKDSEKGQSDNKTILEFFKIKHPVFELQLEEATKKLTIKREITYSESGRIKVTSYINGAKKTKEEFTQKLKEKLFNLQGQKPTFRQLIAKFIRKDSTQIENFLRYLHQSITDADYEKIHLSMFGLNNSFLLTQKHDKEQAFKSITQQIDILTQEFTTNSLHQFVVIINEQLAPLIKARDNFQINQKYELEEQQLNRIQLKINKVETRINELNLSRSLQSERIEKLKEDEFNVDIDALNLLYQEAGFYIKEMQKTFEDTVKFHNIMLKQDMEYAENRLTEMECELLSLRAKRSELAESYSEILQKLGQTGSLAEYTKLNQQIEGIIKNKAEKEALLNTIENFIEKQQIAKKELDAVNLKLASKLDQLDTNIEEFSKLFTSLTQKLYNETYIVTYEKNKNNNYVFKIVNEQGNQGAGKKLGLIAAFDLAYTVFCKKHNITSPSFILHDRLELMDPNQMKILFDFAIEHSVQYVVPIIEDKLSTLNSSYTKNITLCLSESNKFFKI